jgi:hypothetical protein
MPKLSTYATGIPTDDDYIHDPAGTPTNLNATLADLLGANLVATKALTTGNNLITKWTGTGTATTVNITSDWLTQYPNLLGRGASQVLSGGTSGTGTLVLQGDVTSTTAGAISLRSPVRLRDITNETLTAEVAPLLRIRQTKTLDFASASFGGGAIVGVPGLISFEPTVKWNQPSATFGSTFITNTAIYQNVSAVAANIGAVSTLSSTWAATADAASITLGALADVFSAPTLQRTGGGTLTAGADFVNFEGTLTVGAGVTVPNYRAFVAKAPTNSGTITLYKGFVVSAVASADAASATGILVTGLNTTGTNIGIDIGAVTGGTTNIGIRNFAPAVDTPGTKTITVVGDTIPHLTPWTTINNTSGSSKTLTSAPTISDGVDGERIEVTNVGTSDVVIQDQGTLASSNLRLVAATRTLSTRDSIKLRYSAAIGDWCETGFNNVL